MPARVLEGRTALVTGANTGIGAASAVALARLGADVALAYLRLDTPDDAGLPDAYAEHRRETADAVRAAVIAAGSRGHAIEADLSDPAAPELILDEAEQVLGPVSILINNASGWRKDSFDPERPHLIGRRQDYVSADTFDAQFHVDARSHALLMSGLAARHRARNGNWGRIISLTSGGPMGFPGEVSYGAAKAALENYTMAASIELADDGITANVVYPPVTDTGWVTDDVRRFVAASSDHVHVASPEDVAEVIAWLCTDAARLLTGNIIRMR